MLSGELTVRVGHETIQAGAGGFVTILRGVAHQPSKQTADETPLPLIFSPGGMDLFFVEAAEGRHPLQARPDGAGQEARLEAFTGRSGHGFAEFPGSGDNRV